MISSRPSLSIQWHITARCGNRCRHCYVHDAATYKSELENELSYPDLLRVLDELERFERKWRTNIVYFAISGGDPLLREEWRELLTEMKRRGKEIRIMGNPETLTEENVSLMSRMGLQGFQMSLDGLQETHDAIRAPGSFRRTVEALKLLKKHRVQSNVMFTLFPDNARELVPLLRYVVTRTCADSFSFDLGSFVGNAAGRKQRFRPQELRELFTSYLKTKEELRAAGYPIAMREKPSLLKVSQFENRMLYPLGLEKVSIISGCLVGWNSVAILSDGTVLPCRRLPLPVGKLPEQTFEEIFLGSELLKKFRRPEFYQKCGSCDFYQVCRGCPANVYSLTGDPFAKNPLCFRGLVKRKSGAKKPRPAPPLSTTFEEEFEHFSSKLLMVDKKVVREFLENDDLRSLIVRIAYGEEEREKFRADPRRYLAARGYSLGDEQIFFLMNHFSGVPLGPMAAEQECLVCHSLFKFESLALSQSLDAGLR